MNAGSSGSEALDPRRDEAVLEEYCRGELSPAQAAAVEKLMSESPALRRLVDELREGARIGALLRETLADIPVELRRRLICETRATITQRTAARSDHERRPNT